MTRQIIIVDERKATLKDDGSNLRAGDRAPSPQDDVIIRIKPDDIVVEGYNPKTFTFCLIKPKSESELSAENAQRHIDIREAKRIERERSQNAEDPLERAKRALQGDG